MVSSLLPAHAMHVSIVTQFLALLPNSLRAEHFSPSCDYQRTALDIVSRLESYSDLLASRFLPLVDAVRDEDNFRTQVDVGLGATQILFETTLPNKWQLFDEMHNISAWQFNNHNDRLAGLEFMLNSLGDQVKQLECGIHQMLTAPTREEYEILACESQLRVGFVSRRVDGSIAEVDGFETAVINISRAILHFRAEIIQQAALIQAHIASKGLVQNWVTRIDTDVHDLRTLRSAGILLDRLYSKVPRWNSLREARSILEGLRIAARQLELECTFHGSDSKSQRAALQAVANLASDTAQYWDQGKQSKKC
ncbi:hypothetical protein FB451DRAFT_1560251 [Mycena latifolia]|nr:hypothetical protein FB451DRAFT_1560251 [Mycena latifolia]